VLADILCGMDGDVIIVGLNNFLSHWGRMTYGSLNVRDGNVTYMALKYFSKMKPNPNTHVIFDEIDQMLGVNSFDLIERDHHIMAVYQASLMKQWKSVIGFSGTIS
jgi:hypothetical protein